MISKFLSWLFVGTSIGKQIQHELIPAIAHLCQLYPLRVDNIFSSDFLNPFKFNRGLSSFDCTDLIKSNIIFNAFLFKWVCFLSDKTQFKRSNLASEIIGDRDMTVWNSALVPLVKNPASWDLEKLDKLLEIPFNILPTGLPKSYPTSSEGSYPPPDWCAVPRPADLEVINTGYQPGIRENSFPVERPKDPPGGGKCSPEEVAEDKIKYELNSFKFTEKERVRASKAKPVTDIVQLRKIVRLKKCCFKCFIKNVNFSFP